MEDNKKVVTCFVCHNNDTINFVINHNKYIIFVGNNNLDEKYLNNPKIIIARNLPYNIENEPKLLTFTAWYAIIKNNLFKEYEYICILEYDCILDNKFFENLNVLCSSGNHNVISFLIDKFWFLYDINVNVFLKFLKLKEIEFNKSNDSIVWPATTNHCIKRNILSDFVVWYYPTCLNIKLLDYNKLSCYHERLFYIFIEHNKLNYTYMKGLKHIQLNSHSTLNSH